MAGLGALVGCGSFSERTVKNAKSQLEAKYNAEFTAETIGRRYDSETATMYFHPVSDETLHFKVVYDTKTETVTDNYAYAKLMQEIDRRLRTACSDAGFTVCSEPSVYGSAVALVDPDVEFAEIMAQAKPEQVTVMLAADAAGVQSALDAQRLIDTLTAFQLEQLPDSRLTVAAWFIPSDRYAACQQEFDGGVVESNTRLSYYDPVGSASINIENGTSAISAEELFAACGGA